MELSQSVIEYYDDWDGHNPFSNSDDESEDSDDSDDSESEEDKSGHDSNPYFDRDCPTNLAMMDVWSEKICEDRPFVFS
jgi:hypothetical protein